MLQIREFSGTESSSQSGLIKSKKGNLLYPNSILKPAVEDS